MAEKEGPIHDAVAHVKWFFFALAVLIFLWFYTGGYQRNQTNSNPLLIPPTALGVTGRTGTIDVDRVGFFKFIPSTVNLTPDAASYSTDPVESTYNNPNAVDTKSSGQVYTIKQTDVAVKSGIETSKYAKEISIENYSAPGSEKPYDEYVTIRASASNSKKIMLTGWKLKSGVYGQTVEIGNGVYLPQLGSINTEQPIELSAGERAIVVTGRSPIGVSFRENLCTGYFEQHQDFRPSLSSNCPMMRDEDIPADPHGFNNYCLDTLDRIPRCQVFTAFTTQLTPECQRYIVNYNNYPGCVNLHKNQPNFYSATWRVFLGQDKSIWHTKREIIELVDPTGKIVDTVSF